MTSPAFQAWRSSRLARIDRLVAAHPESPGSTTDLAVTQEWTQALVLMLAGEFQGYCRDLHNFVAQEMVKAVTVPGSRMRAMLFEGLTVGRALDLRSADPKTIQTDFSRLGIELWAAIGTPETVAGWRNAVRLLHRARSGVIHDDGRAREQVQAEGWPFQLDSIRRWRDALDEIAVAMEVATSQDIADLFGKNRIETGE